MKLATPKEETPTDDPEATKDAEGIVNLVGKEDEADSMHQPASQDADTGVFPSPSRFFLARVRALCVPRGTSHLR